MRERIKLIMDEENLTPSLFADKLNVGRAVISHILNGRNNPSLDVVTRILDSIDYIDADWLLSGKGSMRRADSAPNVSHRPVSTSLFDTKVASEPSLPAGSYTTVSSVQENAIPNALEASSVAQEDAPSISQTTIDETVLDKKVSKIIIYYTDNTFQSFNPDNTPF